jgi:hypothetical protein
MKNEMYQTFVAFFPFPWTQSRHAYGSEALRIAFSDMVREAYYGRPFAVGL